MANYTFETMSASDAANFTATDNLVFQTATAATVGAVDNPPTSGPLGTTSESITLTSAGHSLTFGAAAVSAASQAGNLIFLNGDGIELGTNAVDSILTGGSSVGHGLSVYGFGGADTINFTSAANDTINGGDGNDTITGSSTSTALGGTNEIDYYMGGGGNDVITGGAGNDHIYGNLFGSTAGAADGADTLTGGDGNDYIQGNAGADSINGGLGNDVLYGGADNDTIVGDVGNDYLQGNKGLDNLDGGDGNDILHGGMDNDILTGGNGNDNLFGDAGNDLVTGGNGSDTIHGGLGYDTLVGSAGNDVFVFGGGEASDADVRASGGGNLTDVISDFTDGEDHLNLGFTVASVLHAQTGITFADVDAAETYAQTLLTGHADSVAAIYVGTDTYLFYDDTHTSGTINSVIQVTGVADTAFNTTGTDPDFV